ncbi:hypothetical protein GCM10028806_54960 [Spirosoma terrae]|uniref:Uncharacterized protein n=1 Tax=Spirosoma terrae TaxID=1968276 RepID=A0A6L9LE46_9BACT|nr:hypothetical protein [Spirosoma terrae]NDU98825.1 hypothetical protein [Spirosoma terrae]
MTTYLTTKHQILSSTLILLLAILINSCSKPQSTEPDAVLPATYQLKNIRYFLYSGDRVDTITVPLKGAILRNPSSTSSTQQVTEDLSELVKTSQFTFDPSSQLPKELDLSKFEVHIPQAPYGHDRNSLVQSSDTYPLSSSQQQKPYTSKTGATSTIIIPPQSKIDIIRQIDAYQLSCTFEGFLENTTTGQRYLLKGKWQGLLQYNNLAVTLKQSAL